MTTRASRVPKKRKTTQAEWSLTIVSYAVVTVFAAFCLIPFIMLIMASITDETAIMVEGYRLIPSKFSFNAYELILQTGRIPDAYKVSIFVTIVGTTIAMLITSMCAYGVSVQRLKYRNRLSFLIYFTMLFNGGLVPSYMLITRYLNLSNNIWVLIIPGLCSPWNLFLLRNFFKQIPPALSESAKIDGASEIRTLFSIILPISLPAIASVSLFYALAFWNEWFRALLYITNKSMYPLQYLVREIMRNIDVMNEIAAQVNVVTTGYVIPSYSARMATAVVTIGPIILLYPFVQKYFVKGLMVGSVKG